MQQKIKTELYNDNFQNFKRYGIPKSSAAWRAARAMGYKKMITYIMESENGTSLKAAGWKCIGQAGGLRWTGKRKPTVDLYPAQMKLRFERTAESDADG